MSLVIYNFALFSIIVLTHSAKNAKIQIWKNSSIKIIYEQTDGNISAVFYSIFKGNNFPSRFIISALCSMREWA